MKERLPIIMDTVGLALLFGLIYKLRRQGDSAEEIKLVTKAIDKNLRETKEINHTLRRTRAAVNQIHQYLLPVQKGVKKPTA